MESASVEATDMGPPSEAEIAARLERATRSVLASSSLASYSYSESSAREQLSQLPSLADLLTHVGPPDCPRCPSCRAPLPFGPRSRICLACDANFVEIPTPYLTSTLAFRRFSEALGLETDLGVAEGEHFPEQEVYIVNKSSASSSAPVEARAQKGLLRVEASSDQENSPLEAKMAERSGQISLPHTRTSGDVSSVTPVDTVGATYKHSSILDYSANLEGISLDDFFSNQNKQEASTPTNSDITSIDVSGAVMSLDTPSIKVRKDSLFWDPLSGTIIPDGFDMMESTSEMITQKDIALDQVTGVEEDDDPFSSWEGDFQSAPPATTDTPTSHTFVSQSVAQPGEFDDFFGNFVNTEKRGGAESLEIQGNNGWANDEHFFGLNTDTTVGINMDVDDLLFGSEWQPSATLATNSSLSTSFFNVDDMLGPLSSAQKEMPRIDDNSVDSAQEGNLTATEDEPLTEPHTAKSAGRKKKIVGSLLAQLHDLSFMLTDKLVIKTEGKDPKLNSSK